MFKHIINVISSKLKQALNISLKFMYRFLKKIINIRKPKVYKLRGYTTISRVDKKIKSEQNQRLLRNILVGAIFALLIALFLIIFNPLKDLREIFRIVGI